MKWLEQISIRPGFDSFRQLFVRLLLVRRDTITKRRNLVNQSVTSYFKKTTLILRKNYILRIIFAT